MASTTLAYRSQASQRGTKTVIVACDGSWRNALGKDGNDPPTNITKLVRGLVNTRQDGRPQVIMYHPGVGSSGRLLDSSIGGTFGLGLGEDIRELYSFICNNYADGDDIIITGFSRGAFTARSVADFIASVGLLTQAGLEHFYDIFEDWENIGDANRKTDEFICGGLAPYHGEQGKARIHWESERKLQYRSSLKKNGWTRDTCQDGTEITIKAVGVWETISDKVEHAFQAVGLDEPRASFLPALWERVHGNKTKLKQVWFPGDHSTVGGGWYDQQIANIAFAWMCDQLSTVGVEFDLARMTSTFRKGLSYSAAHPFPFVPSLMPQALQAHPIPWAVKPIFPASDARLTRDTTDASLSERTSDAPKRELWATARPWGLGQIRYPTSFLQVAAGTTVRYPGMFVRINPEDNEATDEPLLETDERIHSSVRVRLAARGLGSDDKEVWSCPSLTAGPDGSPLWKLERVRDAGAASTAAPELRELELGYPADGLYPAANVADGWQWVFVGTEQFSKAGHERVPQENVLPEEPLVGYWERLLLALTAGDPDVYAWAEKNAPAELMLSE